MAMVHALALALGLAAAQATEQALPVPATLDVIVRDARGRNIETLTAADFIVTENGKPVPVTRARFVKVDGSTTGAVARPVAASTATAEDRASGDARFVGIYLDEFHVTRGPRADEVREALARWVLESLGPDDLIVVLKPLDSLLAIPVSANREAAAEAIRSFQPRRGDYTPRTSFERNFIAGAPANIDTARAQITASSLHALVTRMGRVASQRKTLLILSEGLDRAGVRRRDGELPGLNSVALAANRVHVSVYPIDTSIADLPADADDEARARERLETLARETAGEVIGRRLAVSEGLARALHDASGYYALSIAPPVERPDGRLHAVEVSLRRAAAGTTLRPRKGYWSPSEAEIRPTAPLPSVLPVSTPRLVARRTSPLIRPWFGLSKGPDGSRRVDFVWEPTPRTPGDRTTAPMPARVALSVTAPDGTPVFSGIVAPTSIPAPGAAAGGAPARVSFASPPGRLLVEMAIEDATSRVIDHDVRDVAVNALDGPLHLGTVEVLRARNAREQNLLLRDPYAAPVATRAFRRVEQLILRLPVLSTSGQPRVTAQLLSDIGGPMRALAVTPVPGREDVFQVELPLSSLATGGYAVEFRAQTDAAAIAERLSFRITP